MKKALKYDNRQINNFSSLHGIVRKMLVGFIEQSEKGQSLRFIISVAVLFCFPSENIIIFLIKCLK